jgi:hypothetical protein
MYLMSINHYEYLPPYQLRLFLIAGGAIPYPAVPFNAAETACMANGSAAELYPFGTCPGP